VSPRIRDAARQSDVTARFSYNRPTAQARQRHIRQALETVPRGCRVVDVGAGEMPYKGLVEEYGLTYIAVDIDGPAPVRARAEELPFATQSLEVILCLQVLEHVESPDAALAEFARVLKPGGRVLLSTHGVFPYHPHPRDLWRWTGEGLATIFDAHGFDATVHGLAGSATALAMLTGYYVNLALKRHRRLSPLRYAIPALLAVGERVDRRVPELSDPWRDGTLFCNYFVDARKRSVGVVA
jgi:SAM-dependent methyltransferase